MNIISKEQDMMIELILSGANITEIAKKIGCTRQSIYTWKDKPHIKAEIEARRYELKRSAHNNITKDICTYVDNIKDLACNSTDQRVRLQANRYLIDQCLGVPTAAKDESIITGDESNKDVNTLKQEMEQIKNFKVV